MLSTTARTVLLIPADALGICSDLIDGESADRFQGCQRQEAVMRIDQAPSPKKAPFLRPPASDRRGNENAPPPIRQDRPGIRSRTINTSPGVRCPKQPAIPAWMIQIRSVSVNLSHERTRWWDILPTPVISGAIRCWPFPGSIAAGAGSRRTGQIVDSWLNFKRCGGCQ